VTFGVLTTDNIERIEIVKGGMSSIWGGNASAGVINIITKGAKKGLHAHTKIGYGSYDTKKASLHAAYDNGALSGVLNASRLKTDGFSTLLPRDAEADGYTNTSYNLKLGYRFDPHNRFGLYYNQIDYDVEYDSAFPAPSPDDALSKSKGKQKNYKADYNLQYNNYSMNLSASKGDFHREYSYGTFDVLHFRYLNLLAGFVRDGDGLVRYPFPYHYVIAQIESQRYYEPYSYLADYLEPSGKPLFVFFENLYVVIDKADGAKPECCCYHQYDIYIFKLCKKQGWDKYCTDDNNTAHGRCPHFLVLAFKAEVAYHFSYLLFLKQFDYLFAEYGRKPN